MSLIDMCLLGVILLILGLAIRSMLLHPSKCGGNCATCTGCSGLTCKKQDHKKEK